ncbi:MAG TPA: hypothetical protein VIV66_01370, partial [Pyrinomonadaceae bacterium]
ARDYNFFVVIDALLVVTLSCTGMTFSPLCCNKPTLASRAIQFSSSVTHHLTDASTAVCLPEVRPPGDRCFRLLVPSLLCIS